MDRREVVDVLADRTTIGAANGLASILRSKSSAATAAVSNALGAHEGAPQARQVADRLHLLQNLHRNDRDPVEPR
jgi:hypothetical protein